MAKAAKEETKVTEMENKIEKMTKFLADNKNRMLRYPKAGGRAPHHYLPQPHGS